MIQHLFACDTERKLKKFLDSIKSEDTVGFKVGLIARNGYITNVVIKDGELCKLKNNGKLCNTVEEHSVTVAFKYRHDKEYYEFDGVTTSYESNIYRLDNERIIPYINIAKLIIELAYCEGYFDLRVVSCGTYEYSLLTPRNEGNKCIPHNPIVKKDVPSVS